MKQFNLETQAWEGVEENKTIRALELLQKVYRGEVEATPQQMRAAIEALPFENPKLSAVGVGYLENNTFAERLDRAIDRRERAKLIEGHAIRDE
jgi:hypothetical protein